MKFKTNFEDIPLYFILGCIFWITVIKLIFF